MRAGRMFLLVLIGAVLLCAAAAAAPAAGRTSAPTTPADGSPQSDGWPAPVPGFKAPLPGEHPRLLFRKTDIASLKARAKTPEGQAIIKRLRVCLNGSDGESMPEKFGVKGPVDKDGAGPLEGAPPGIFIFSHVAGYGMLYVLTGDKKYADPGRECMEKSLEGYRDRDQRYSFKAPYGALRAGPSLGWTALGYDLCYDGWDDAYRRKVADAIQNYNEGKWMSLEELARGARQRPGSSAGLPMRNFPAGIRTSFMLTPAPRSRTISACAAGADSAPAASLTASDMYSSAASVGRLCFPCCRVVDALMT
ncbi:MAG: hypothetical protein FJ288_12200 [Planctomycetes bacterium]|nr:hypothetical protein [Planctomycetota bacterium]